MTPKQRLVGMVGAATVALLLTLTPKYEGVRLTPYRDPVGILTVCAGDTKDVVPGKRLTNAECDDRLATRLAEHYADISKCISVPLTSEQRAALLDFAYNVGAEKFCSSTLARKLNAGDYSGACAELSRWTKAAGKELPGLVSRRAEERALCEGRA